MSNIRIQFRVGLAALIITTGMWGVVGRLPSRAASTTLTVTDSADSGPNTLRGRLAVAADGDTITFNLPANTSVVLISPLTVPVTVTLDASGSTNLVISGNTITRVFEIGPAARTTMIGFTVANGRVGAGLSGGAIDSTSEVELVGMTFSANASGLNGGAIIAPKVLATNSAFLSNTTKYDGGALYVTDMSLASASFISNTAIGAGISASGRGGGAYVTRNATVYATLFERNVAAFDEGGGLVVKNTATISASTFISNFALGLGGGLSGGNVNVWDSDFTANTADAGGGGIRSSGKLNIGGDARIVGNQTLNGNGGGVYGSDVRLKDTILLSNTSTYLDGGGVYASGSLVVYDSLFQGNRATQTGADGGAIYSKASSTTMISNTRFIENSATGAGGAIATEVPGAPRYGLSLVNSLLVRNSAGGTGQAVRLRAISTLLHNTVIGDPANIKPAIYAGESVTTPHMISNTIFSTVTFAIAQAGAAQLSEGNNLYFNVITRTQGGAITSTAQFTGDPLFVDPSDDDYHIGPGSPAWDAGVAAGINIDFDHEPRPRDAGPDIGFDEIGAIPVPKSVYIPNVAK